MKKNIKLFVTTGNGIDEPSFIQVLENNFPEIPVLVEDSIGNYKLTNTGGLFIQDKTFISKNFPAQANSVGKSFFVYDVYWVSVYEIAIKSHIVDLTDGSVTPASGLGHSELEITVVL